MPSFSTQEKLKPIDNYVELSEAGQKTIKSTQTLFPNIVQLTASSDYCGSYKISLLNKIRRYHFTKYFEINKI